MKMQGIAKRILKIIIALAVSILAVLAILAVYVRVAVLPGYPTTSMVENIEVTPERVRQGKRIASMRCLDCHVDPVTGLATGRKLTEIPSIVGVSRSANITRDRNSGIGAWTDGELMYALRTGISRDGRLLPPWMPRLRRMSDDDLRAVIAFLRSDDPSLGASPTAGRSEWSLFGRALFHFVWKPEPAPAQPVAGPTLADRVAYGKYIVQDLADCWTCHSGDFAKLNQTRPESTKGYLAGGTKLHDKAGAPVTSANITPDDLTGIGRWSDDDFARAVRHGIRPDGSSLHYPMAPYVELTSEEVLAVRAYLRTVPPIRTARLVREEQKAMATTGSSRREALYIEYGCRSCHGDLGVGMGDLRHASKHFPGDDELEAWIRRPSRLRPGTKMPDFDGVIRNEDYAPLIEHVRSLGINSQ